MAALAGGSAILKARRTWLNLKGLGRHRPLLVTWAPPREMPCVAVADGPRSCTSVALDPGIGIDTR